MQGYKGIQYINGILRARFGFGKTKDIFEIEVPKQKVKIDDGMGFTENGYSFCKTIEEVLMWENYCKPLKLRKAEGDCRLFLIDTLDGKVTGCSNHYKAEQIVVLREITHDEIVQHFTKNPAMRANMEKELWETYCNDKIEEYKLQIDADEIDKTLIENCARLGQVGVCKQDFPNFMLSKCKECEGKEWSGDTFHDLTDYYYLYARKKLYDGTPLENIEEYHSLKGCDAEQDSLRLLSEWLEEKRHK